MTEPSTSGRGFKIATLLTGGLAGAVVTGFLSWYFLFRPQPIVLTYGITTVSIGKDATVASLIPDLKILIGNAEIPAIHIHSIEFTVQSGKDLDSGVIAIQFDSPPTHYGKLKIETPSDIHRLACGPVSKGFECIFTPLSTATTGKYKISIASNHSSPPRLVSASTRVQLTDVDQLVRDQNFWRKLWISLTVVMVVLLSGIYLVHWFLQFGDDEKTISHRYTEHELIEFQKQEDTRLAALRSSKDSK